MVGKRFYHGLGVLLLASANAMASDAHYFDIPRWPGDQEACPSPGALKDKSGVITAPAKQQNAVWLGALPATSSVRVERFEKATFMLNERGTGMQGQLLACSYALSSGGSLHLRLDLGEDHGRGMWVERSRAWDESRNFSSSAILECTHQQAGGCEFFLK